MGFVKQQWIEAQERSWSSCDDMYVCDECVRDEYLKCIVEFEATIDTCDFCGRSDGEPIAAPANSLMTAIAAAFYSVFTDPVHVAAYCSREGGYQVPTLDIEDAVEKLFNSQFSDEFRQTVVDSIEAHTEIVCDVDPYRLSEDDILSVSWKGFVEHVKHRSRFFVSRMPVDRDDLDDETIHPAEFLSRLSVVISRSGLVHESDEVWYRARVHDADVEIDSGGTLGTPRHARFANRMSPVGICMFYGAWERETAIAEVRDPEKVERKLVTSGAFKASRPLRILDLRNIPQPPSLFDLEERDERIVRLFLMDFARDLAKPISKTGVHHIEYVPTQVVTEFFRLVYRHEGRSLDGIIFASSRREGGSCCVLFFEGRQCVDDDGRTERERFVEDWLVLQCSTLETWEL